MEKKDTEEYLKEEKLQTKEETTETMSEETPEQPVEEQTDEETHQSLLAKAQAEAAEWKDKYLRQVAEFDNYRKRVIKEKAELIKNGGQHVISTILPIIDDLERANDNMDRMEDIAAVKEGVSLIIEKFLTTLKREGLEKIEAVGQNFDVDYHEAVAMVPGQPDDLHGKVLDCIQTGYTLNDKVIRHAKVAVAE